MEQTEPAGAFELDSGWATALSVHWFLARGTDDALGANDTSAAAGFAPFSQTESVVLQVERYLNSAEFKKQFPETGEDTKVMGIRHLRDLHLTVAMAFVDRLVASSRAYFERKEQIKQRLHEYTRKLAPNFRDVKIDLNALDDPRSSDGMYLTVLGISAEGADSGQVGRGNRANGLISLNRPQSIEAHAGKNPVSHIGKIYSYFSDHVARQIYSKVEGIREVWVYLCSQIGRPIQDPLMSSIQLILKPGVSLQDVRKPAEAILSGELARINDFTARLATEGFYRQQG
jgi:S-adenosylmethionine synthetase